LTWTFQIRFQISSTTLISLSYQLKIFIMFHQFMGIFALATIATAWTIPAGQTDGVYSVHVDETGQTVHTFLQDLAPTVSGFCATTHKSRTSRAASGASSIDLKGREERRKKEYEILGF
jgi:hypothetical protein